MWTPSRRQFLGAAGLATVSVAGAFGVGQYCYSNGCTKYRNKYQYSPPVEQQISYSYGGSAENGNIATDKNNVYIADGKNVNALDRQSGDKNWTSDLSFERIKSVVGESVESTNVVSLYLAGNLLVVNVDGKILIGKRLKDGSNAWWRSLENLQLYSSGIFETDGQRLFLPGNAGVAAYSLSTGEQLWKKELSNFCNGIATGAGQVYVTVSGSTQIHALGAEDGKLKWSFGGGTDWSRMHDVGFHNGTVFGYNEQGLFSTTDQGEGNWQSVFEGSIPAYSVNDVLQFTGKKAVVARTGALRVIETESGNQLYRYPVGLSQIGTPTLVNGNAYFIEYISHRGSPQCALHGWDIDANTHLGTMVLEYDADGPVSQGNQLFLTVNGDLKFLRIK